MTILTYESCIVHGPPEAFGIPARMALITALIQLILNKGIGRGLAGGRICAPRVRGCRHIICKEVRELGMKCVDDPGVSLVNSLIPAVGRGIARSQGAQMRQVKSGGVMTCLTRNRR